jgi:hypothetical protein
MSKRILALLLLSACLTVVFSNTAIAAKPGSGSGAPDTSTQSWFKKPKGH